jgi:hypothetical protein
MLKSCVSVLQFVFRSLLLPMAFITWYSKNDKVQIQIGVCALLWVIRNIANDFVLTNQKLLFFACYLFGHTLYMYVIISLAGKAHANHEIYTQCG